MQAIILVSNKSRWLDRQDYQWGPLENVVLDKQLWKTLIDGHAPGGA